MISRSILIFFLVISSSMADEQSIAARQWLEKMSYAMKNLNYRGTVVFFKNDHLTTMKYSHIVSDGIEKERLLSLNSPMREITRDLGGVRCLFKESQKVVINHHPVSKSFIVDLPESFSAVENFYSFNLQGSASVAMRSAYVFEIKAMDDYRYDLKIWVDKESLIPLKVEVFNLDGMTLEQVVFTEFEFGSTIGAVALGEEVSDSETKHVHQSISSSIEKADFVLERMPKGFKPVFYTQMKMENSEQSVDHILLSDGFASVSVYRELKTDDAPVGLQRLGAVNSFSYIMGNFYITAMGEVPEKTVKLIAQGARMR